MEERQLKEVMEKIHISSEMEEEILKNVIKEENKIAQTGVKPNTKRKKWQSHVAVAAAVIAVVGVGGVTAHALVNSLVKERMESIPQTEVENIVAEVDLQQAEVSTYSRELTDEEKERQRELTLAYQQGHFPEGELKKIEDESQVEPDVLCFLPDTAYFYLPERELTDEELLQIIDYSEKVNYALQKRYEEEHTQEVQEKEAKEQELAQTTQNEGGISEGEAITKAEEWLKTIYGEVPDGMEMNHYIESAEESMHTSPDGSAVYSVNYSIDASDYYYFSISGNGDLLYANHSGLFYEAEEVSIAEAENRVQILYQAAEDHLKNTFAISEDYSEIYCRYTKNSAGDGVDLNLMKFWFVKEDGMAYKLTFSCDSMELVEFSISNYEKAMKDAKETEEMGLLNESVQVKLK